MILSVGQIQVLMLVIARVAGLFIETPVFSARSIPALVKVVLAAWISLCFWFVVPLPQGHPMPLLIMIVAIAQEVLIGFMIGFISFIIMTGVQAAGDLMDLQMGLSVATALDPIFGAVITVMGRIAFMTAMIVFLIVNGHHMILRAVHASFTALPIGSPLVFSPTFVFHLLEAGTKMWLIAIQLSAPVLLLIFLSDFAFGLVSRVAPQVNVFMLGFQVKPALGLIGLLLTLSLFIDHIARLVPMMAVEIGKLFIALRS